MKHTGTTSNKETKKTYHILILYVLCNIWNLIYITIFTRTKYVHQMLANLQQVSSPGSPRSSHHSALKMSIAKW